MKYKLSTAYCWYERGSMIVKMYFINGVPFTFDEMPDVAYGDPGLIDEANQNESYEPEDLFKASFYLIDEQCHPCLFELELENPELMPQE
jgi:hypothetical protein